MKWFVAYRAWHVQPFANMWTPCSGVIDVHPLIWIRQQPDTFRLTWWKKLDAEDELAFSGSG